jgi:hypothetical protein
MRTPDFITAQSHCFFNIITLKTLFQHVKLEGHIQTMAHGNHIQGWFESCFEQINYRKIRTFKLELDISIILRNCHILDMMLKAKKLTFCRYKLQCLQKQVNGV